MRAIGFVVEGAPVPKGRPRVFRRKVGRGTVTITPAKTLAYEQRVKLVALAEGVRRLAGAVCVSVEFYLPDARNRDLDNLAKSILDGLNGVAYADDSQVCGLYVSKLVDRERPRAEVQVWTQGERLTVRRGTEPEPPFDADDFARPKKAGKR